MRFDIVYVVSHGFAVRMVTQTNLLGKLVESGSKVALIAPDSTDANLKGYCKKHQVSLFGFNENGHLSNKNYIFKRKYFLEQLEENPALWEKHIYAVRYNRSLNPLTHIWPRYYGIIYRLRKFFPEIKRRFIRNEKRHLRSSKARQLIENLNPKKLVVTYPINFNEATLLYHGNQNPGTETWIHLLSWDNITCKGHFPELGQKYIAWGPIMKSELQEFYGVEDVNIKVCGVPHFDVHLEVKQRPAYKKYIVELGLDPEKNYLLFAMSSPRFAPREIDIVEDIADKVRLDELPNSIQLVIRPHPQNIQSHLADKSWLKRLKELAKIEGVTVDMPRLSKSRIDWSMEMSDMMKLAQLITGAKIVLNSGSTVCIDALLHDKPVIITAFDADVNIPYWRSARRLVDYKHLKKLISFGGIYTTRNFKELYSTISQVLANPDRNVQDRKLTIENQCDLSESATDKVLNALLN